MLRKCSNKNCNNYTFKDKCPKCNFLTFDPMYKYREKFVKKKEKNS
ncbi:MAG: ribosome biogenesis protein [Candidatus Pacearchaeota archaeon]